MIFPNEPVVAVIGLGYVGLPLAVAFGKRFHTIGYDLDAAKVANHEAYRDPTGSVTHEDLVAATRFEPTTDETQLASADVIVVAVPTPVDDAHNPDFRPLTGASITAGRNMKRGAIVVYESTVYPGATEEVCVPLLEQYSGMTWGTDFCVGYSPERINPGDLEHTLAKIVKIVAGDNAETCDALASLYGTIITAGIHKAASIKVAEAAKVIENTQRDLNIALMNELAIIFDKIGLDTTDVLRAAGTKWNFMPFRPGLVGGHCIGVDPYYLTYKAEVVGYHPDVILAGRRINDSMATFVASKIIKQIIQSGCNVKGAIINVLGLTFKENCPDLRNSKVYDIISEFNDFGCRVYVHDPLASAAEAKREYRVDLCSWDALPEADAIVVAVPHAFYLETPLDQLLSKLKAHALFADVRSAFDKNSIQATGRRVWRL